MAKNNAFKSHSPSADSLRLAELENKRDEARLAALEAKKNETPMRVNLYSGNGFNLPEVDQNSTGEGLKALGETFAAPVFGYADTATFGATSRIPGVKEMMARNPMLSGAGQVAGAFSKYSPFGLAMKGVQGAADVGTGALRSGLNFLGNGASKVTEQVLPKAMQRAGEAAIKPTTSLIEALANVPLASGGQEVVNRSGRAIFGGDKIGNLQDEAKNAATDELTLSLGLPLRVAANFSRGVNIPKHIYAATGPLDHRDVKRAADSGRDLIQEAIDQSYYGGLESLRGKGRANKTKADAIRRDIVAGGALNYADDLSTPVQRKDVLRPLDRRSIELMNQGAKIEEAGQPIDLKNRLEQTIPKELGPYELEQFLRRQKAYISEKANEQRRAGVYSGDVTAGPEIEGRRSVIMPGLDLQEKQLATVLNPEEAKNFRRQGLNYGLASNIERGASNDLAKSFGTLRGATSAMGTTAAVGLDRMLKGPSASSYLTLLRQMQRTGQLSEEDARKIAEQVANE
jgi:hypothetical protein